MNQLANPDAALRLQDIHQAPPPSWWPPAPGWWLLAAIVLLVVGVIAWRLWRRRRRRRAITRLFDDALARASTPQAQVAAMSELLRRAARNIDPGADTLPGERWLAFLDRGLPSPVFVGRLGEVLLDGGFRRSISQADADALRVAARARFLDWMAAR
jgi:hypothetical protein